MVVAAAVVALFLVVIGRQENEVWRGFLASPCNGSQVSTASGNICESRFQSVLGAGHFNVMAMAIGVLLGPIFGSILGVNAVAREVEVGTTRLAWTQSFSRTRWLMSKFVVNGAILVVTLGTLCAVYGWWIKVAHYSARISPTGFPIAGFLPLVYGVVAFTIVVLLGLVLRHAGWSLVAGLLLTAVLVFVVEHEVRPILASPHFAVVSSTQVSLGSSSGFYSSGGVPSNSWAIGGGVAPSGIKTTPSSHTMEVSSNDLYSCMASPRGQTRDGSAYCMRHLRLEHVGLFVPDSDFWYLQFSEYGIYLAFAFCLAAGANVRLRMMLA
jgi:hypothetical protein